MERSDLTDQMVTQPFRGTSTNQRNRKTGISLSSIKGNAKSCTWGRNIQYRLGDDQLEGSFTGKDLVILVDVHQQYALGAKKANKILGCIRQSVASNLREGSIVFHSTLVSETTPGVLYLLLGSPARDMDLLEQVCQRLGAFVI